MAPQMVLLSAPWMVSQSVPQLVLSCGAGLFSLVYVILLIIFFVTVLRQRRELLELQYHDTHPSHDSGDSTVPRSAE